MIDRHPPFFHQAAYGLVFIDVPVVGAVRGSPGDLITVGGVARGPYVPYAQM